MSFTASLESTRGEYACSSGPSVRAARSKASRAHASASVPYQHLGGRRVIRVAGVIELRTVRYQHDHVHPGAQLDILARRRNAVFECQAAIRGDGYVHEEVDVGADVLLRETPVV